jgi:hypothetical protein
LASAGKDSTIRLWDTATGRELRRLAGQEDELFALAFAPNGRVLAAAGKDRTIRLWEVATGKERHRLVGHEHYVFGLVFSPNGRVLASASEDGTVRLWPLAGSPLGARTSLDRAALWEDLADENAARADEAIRTLAARPAEAVAFLRARLKPVSTVAPEAARLIDDLDSDRFAVRREAAEALARGGDSAVTALRRALQGTPTAEVRRQAVRLLEVLAERVTPDQVRTLRALEVLEYLGTMEARQVLQVLALGLPEAPITQDARAVLGRLARR